MDFSYNNDKPISNDSLNDMLEKMQQERELLLPNNSNNNPNNNVIENQKKLNSIEDIFTVQKNIINEKNKKVSFNVNINDITNNEYKYEKKVNDSIKLNNIYNLLKEIDIKQNEITNKQNEVLNILKLLNIPDN